MRGGARPKVGGLKSVVGAVVTAPTLVAESGKGICDNEGFGPGTGLSIGKPGAEKRQIFFLLVHESKYCNNTIKKSKNYNLRPGNGGGNRLTIGCPGISRPGTGGGTPSGGIKLPPIILIGPSNPEIKYLL